jgi:hypothetical protein
MPSLARTPRLRPRRRAGRRRPTLTDRNPCAPATFPRIVHPPAAQPAPTSPVVRPIGCSPYWLVTRPHAVHTAGVSRRDLLRNATRPLRLGSAALLLSFVAAFVASRTGAKGEWLMIANVVFVFAYGSCVARGLDRLTRGLLRPSDETTPVTSRAERLRRAKTFLAGATGALASLDLLAVFFVLSGVVVQDNPAFAGYYSLSIMALLITFSGIFYAGLFGGLYLLARGLLSPRTSGRPPVRLDGGT